MTIAALSGCGSKPVTTLAPSEKYENQIVRRPGDSPEDSKVYDGAVLLDLKSDGATVNPRPEPGKIGRYRHRRRLAGVHCSVRGAMRAAT